ncbi:MAG: CBS domain-containing protein [Gemmatimonadota bacterium]
MTLGDILRNKGHHVVTIEPDRTVLDAMRLLVEHGIGGVVVMREGADMVGILTERDVLRLGAEDPRRLTDTPVSEAMTTELVVATPEDGLSHVMDVMTHNRIRHLPVVQAGRLAGIVSIGDVVNACRKDVEGENEHLRKYIHGVTA